MKQISCAIYTRKSSEEGLEQTFNSLDAQREACAAYILSQASEGWTALPDIYDDGGLSGGSLERPALKRLLSEVADGRVDIIVVYKVDRLTRSLLDFSRLVEAFDKAGTSFVSVTQSFNTTTSMGRLTLNMLLSFAQFEREVTAERIRDKIAASKAKGMWMGGTPPLGYKPDGRSLEIVEEHAAIIHSIFERYLALGNVRLVADHLARDNVRSPVRATLTGKAIGGVPFSRGQIYSLLKCPTYVGEVHHRCEIYPGLHKGIITRDVWDRVQALLGNNLQGPRRGDRATRPALLAGKALDADGIPLVSSHATKGNVRYHYYISRDQPTDGMSGGIRMPARELETAVTVRIAQLFDDGLALIGGAGLDVAPADIARVIDGCGATRVAIIARDRATVRGIVTQVRVQSDGLSIDCDTHAIAAALGVPRLDDAPPTLTLDSQIRLTRSGLMMRLVQDNGAAISSSPNTSLIRLILKARKWWSELRAGELNILELSAREKVSAAYMTRVLRLAFLAPAIVDAVLAGRLRSGVDGSHLTATDAIVASWGEQRRLLLPGA